VYLLTKSAFVILSAIEHLYIKKEEKIVMKKGYGDFSFIERWLLLQRKNEAIELIFEFQIVA